jgi:hypothetical protein
LTVTEGIRASPAPRVDVVAADELGAVACVGAGALVPNRAETSSGGGVEVVARAAGRGDVPVVAGTASGGMFRGGSTAAPCPAAAAGLRLDVDTGTELTSIAGAGTGGVVTVFAGTESGDGVRVGGTAADSPSAGLRFAFDVGDALGGGAWVGAGRGVPALVETEFGNSIRSRLRRGVEVPSLRIDVDAVDELEVFACDGTGVLVPVLTGTESRVRGGVEVAACVGIGGAVPVFAATESGGSARAGGTVAGGPSA